MNISLLCKWWWKLEREEGLWQQIVTYKYMRDKTIYDVNHGLNDSPMWSDLLKVKDIYLQGRNMQIGNGEKTCFWFDTWLYSEPLCITAPVLFELCENKYVTVSQVRNGVSITFRRWLFDDLRTSWYNIMNDMSVFQFSDRPDSVMWNLEKKRENSLSNLYIMGCPGLKLVFFIKGSGRVESQPK